MKYVLDTNIINWLVDEIIKPADLPVDGEFVASHILVDELNRTSDKERRAQLLITLVSIRCELIQTETTIWDISRWGQSKLGYGEIYNSIKTQLDEKNGGGHSNLHDALIAEVAIVNEFTLLTADRDLADVARKHNCKVRHFIDENRV